VKVLSSVEQNIRSLCKYFFFSVTLPFFQFSSFSVSGLVLPLTLLLVVMEGCGGRFSHYDKLYTSLHQGDSEKAVQVIAEAKARYGSTSHLLYLMDRGMTLHLASRYEESANYLEKAHEYVEELYTRYLRQEALSVLVNDTQRPFRGDPYEQVLINVINALNYARLGNLEEALVEARRIDHRLNVLADTVEEDDYQEDPFARYLTGVLYEANGDLSNAFVAYRKAYEGYRQTRSWSEVPIPDRVKKDLLRMTKRLNLENEHQGYLQAFPEIAWEPRSPNGHADVVVVSYHGRAPRLEDRIIDVPVSLDALALVLHTKQLGGAHPQRAGGMDAVLYGLQGQIVRVSLPRVVPQKTRIEYGKVTVVHKGNNAAYHTELMTSITAAAKKNLSDRLPRVTLRAVARAALKMSVAEGIGYGLGAVAKDEETRNLIQALVSALLKVLVITTEEADKRNWRTLPDEMHVSRISVPPGSITLKYQFLGKHGEFIGNPVEHSLALQAGETRFLTFYAAE